MFKALKILGGASLFVLAGMSFASADAVYEACVNANEPAAEGEAQMEICQCITKEIGDNEPLQAEAIGLSAMTAAERTEKASEQANAVMGKCIPAEEGAAAPAE